MNDCLSVGKRLLGNKYSAFEQKIQEEKMERVRRCAMLISFMMGIIIFVACTLQRGIDSLTPTGDSQMKGDVSVTASSGNRYPSATVDSDNDGQINWVLEPNLWNVTGGTGTVRMDWKDASGLSVYIHLTNITQEDSNGWVNAYPEIWYGAKLWNNLGPATDGPIPLPRKLSELNNFTTTVSYSVTPGSSDQPYNFPLETWLARDTSRNRTCRSDEIELMIWFDYYGLQGAGTQVGSVTIGGKNYEIWRKGDCGSGKWEYIAFRPTSPSSSGTITIDWGPFLREAMKYSDRPDWPNLYFTAVELGTEFGTPTYLAHNDLEWKVTSFTMSYGTGNILGSAASSVASSISSSLSSVASSVSSSRSSAISSVSSSRSSAVSSVVSSRSSVASSVASSASTPSGNYTEISVPFTKDGAGEFYWKTKGFSTTQNDYSHYINSWNLDALTINGTSYVNKWVATFQIPASSDGYWYIYYKGSYAWSHFEVK